jgi:hypothetical protein
MLEETSCAFESRPSLVVRSTSPDGNEPHPGRFGGRLVGGSATFAPMRLLSFALLALAALSWRGPSPAFAQALPELSESDRAQARALFAAGAAAADAGRWADAVDSFRRAYDLTRAPSALFNTAFALRALGRYREAARAFERLSALDNVSDSMRVQASELRDEVRGRLAMVRMVGLDPEARHVVRLDAEAVEDSGARPLVVQADPGRHTLDVSRPGFLRFEWAGALGNAEVLELAVELLPEPAEGPATGGGTVFEEAWFWIMVGVVVAAGTGVGIGYADDQAQLRPESMMPIRL